MISQKTNNSESNKYNKFPKPHRTFIPPVSISTAIDSVSRGNLDTPVFNQQDLVVTRKQFIEESKIVAKALLYLGAKKGDIISLSIPNLYQGLVIFKASNSIGAVVTFLNEKASIEEITKYIKLYNSKIFVTYNKNTKFINEILKTTPAKNVINIEKTQIASRITDSAKLDTISSKPNNVNEVINYNKLSILASLYTSHKQKLHNLISGKDEALILYTSGSTGEPKSVVFTNENLMAALMYLRNTTKLEPYDKSVFWWLGVVPFMYPYGFFISVLLPLVGGYGAMLAPNIQADEIDYYYAKDPQVICGSPAFIDITFKNLSADVRFPSLKYFFSGGDFLSAKRSRETIELFKNHGAADATICNGCGNGEVLGCISTAVGFEYKPETVGKLINGPQYQIVNPDTLEQITDESAGELLVHGKHVFKGYFNNADETKNSRITINYKTYYRTGNIGYIDQDGYYVLVGRASRFFINDSFNKVYCEHVQNAISQIESVDECAVVPQKDKEKLYVSKAYVVLKKDNGNSYADSEKTILNSLKNPEKDTKIILKNYEIPNSITFLENLPRTTADKIDYELLKQWAETETKTD